MDLRVLEGEAGVQERVLEGYLFEWESGSFGRDRQKVRKGGRIC